MKLDRIAILLSGICLVHCLAIPILLIALPALGSLLFDSHSSFHWFLIVFGFPVSAVALWIGWRRHGELRPVVIGAAGLVLMVLGITHWFGDAGEISATVFGAVVLMIAHILNMRQSMSGHHAG
ncbi:MAG: MerC domain-containing protein [Proteobacteria bacterium]|nr:MerC domain-containing protein [Pseudomonadota bacterium]